MQTAIKNADARLRANGYLLDSEIEEIWNAEKTPGVLEKFTLDEQKAIVQDLRIAQEKAGKESLNYGTSINDPLEQSFFQGGVSKNKLLKASQELAKKYGIKAGDIFTIDFHVMSQSLKK